MDDSSFSNFAGFSSFAVCVFERYFPALPLSVPKIFSPRRQGLCDLINYFLKFVFFFRSQDDLFKSRVVATVHTFLDACVPSSKTILSDSWDLCTPTGTFDCTDVLKCKIPFFFITSAIPYLFLHQTVAVI